MGYQAIGLDTLASMKAVAGLSTSLGFMEIAPYHANPLPGTVSYHMPPRAPAKS